MHKNISTNKRILFASFILTTFITSILLAQTSSNYNVQQAVIDEGGNTSHSSQHRVNDAVGQPSPVGEATSHNYTVSSGFLGGGKMITPVDVFENISAPASFRLSQNHPNPFNPSTTIEFSLPKASFVTLKIYNLLGEEVATLVSEQRSMGIHKINWDARGLASGVYLYQLVAADFSQTRKLILMR